MKKCKSCQSEIDDKAKKCPHCQTDQRGFFGKHPIITIILGIVALFVVIGVLGGGKGTSSTTTRGNNAQPATKEASQPTTAPQTPTIVGATALVAEFDKNKLAADDKYKGKLIQTTAYIKNISSDITGSPFLSLEPTNDQMYFGTSIQCYFTDKSSLVTLENGQSITVKGTMDEMSLGIVQMKDCSIVK